MNSGTCLSRTRSFLAALPTLRIRFDGISRRSSSCRVPRTPRSTNRARAAAGNRQTPDRFALGWSAGKRRRHDRRIDLDVVRLRPPLWAAAGGLTFGLLYGLSPNWSSSYWGGAFCAFGGALVCGGLVRLGSRTPSRRLSAGRRVGLVDRVACPPVRSGLDVCVRVDSPRHLLHSRWQCPSPVGCPPFSSWRHARCWEESSHSFTTTR